MLDNIFWAYETFLGIEYEKNGEKHIINGNADYTLFYGEPQDVETNLVVVEAKRRGAVSTGVGQLLGYMGVVHRLRELKGKRSKTVYDVCTDSYRPSDEHSNHSLISLTKSNF